MLISRWALKSVLALTIMTLAACGGKGGGDNQPPQAGPGGYPPMACPYGQSPSPSGCVPTNVGPQGIAKYGSSLYAINQQISQKILNNLTNCYFLFWKFDCFKNANSGFVEVTLQSGGPVQVMIDIGGVRTPFMYSPGVVMAGIGQMTQINNSTGTSIMFQYYGWRFEIRTEVPIDGSLTNATIPFEILFYDVHASTGVHLASGTFKTGF
ncbi:MAG: hypothetical protein IT289_09425 [Oligoflexia bacterium]|nr:hypothetical protein [Oligoflexia bacterium]